MFVESEISENDNANGGLVEVDGRAAACLFGSEYFSCFVQFFDVLGCEFLEIDIVIPESFDEMGVS